MTLESRQQQEKENNRKQSQVDGSKGGETTDEIKERCQKKTKRTYLERDKKEETEYMSRVKGVGKV